MLGYCLDFIWTMLAAFSTNFLNSLGSNKMSDNIKNNGNSNVRRNVEVKIPYGKLVWLFLKNHIRYPRLKKKLMAFSEPNLTFGLTDHPLDINSAPSFDIFSAPKKLIARKPLSVLKVKFRERRGNSFIFDAFCYNIFNRDIAIWHIDYDTSPKAKKKLFTLRLDILNPKTYRLRLASGEDVPKHSTPMVVGDLTDKGFEAHFEEDSERYKISTGAIALSVFREDFRIEVRDKKGNLVTQTGGRSNNEFPTANDAFPLGFIKNRKPKGTYAVENFDLFPMESIFGFGERFGSLNCVGQDISIWNIDAQGNSAPRSYKNIPFFISSRGYGVFFNDYCPMTFRVGTKELTKIQVAIESVREPLIDYYLFYGPTPKGVLGQYTALTGRAKMPPRWSFGTWMSRLSYASEEEVIGVAKRLRKEKIPADVINIDTHWSTIDWACDWKFDKERFKDPEGMFRKCKELGFKICLWQIPYVMSGLKAQSEGKKKRAFAKDRGPFVFYIFGEAKTIDFSRDEGISWYKEKLKGLFELGAKAIKVDFGEQIEPHQEFSKYTGREMHNLYPLLYNKAAFEATEDFLGEGNAVIWARSAYAGSQRYPLHWSGDNSSNFSNMFSSTRGGLSLGLSGFSFWSQDVGGFVGIPDDKLYVRWTALSIFQSHIRFHGCPPKFREPWNYSKEAQLAVRKLLGFRYQLIPYLFSESTKATTAGLPVMRPLFLEFPDDPTCLNIEDQFLSGENLLVAPIFTDDDSRVVYLPLGRWYDYWTGKPVEGPGWINVKCKNDRIPLFVRAGCFLPLGEVTQYIDEDNSAPPKKFTLIPSPDADGRIEYNLKDELGEIKFTGVLDKKNLSVTVSSKLRDLDDTDIKVKLPKGRGLTVSLFRLINKFDGLPFRCSSSSFSIFNITS